MKKYYYVNKAIILSLVLILCLSFLDKNAVSYSYYSVDDYKSNHKSEIYNVDEHIKYFVEQAISELEFDLNEYDDFSKILDYANKLYKKIKKTYKFIRII